MSVAGTGKCQRGGRPGGTAVEAVADVGGDLDAVCGPFSACSSPLAFEGVFGVEVVLAPVGVFGGVAESE